MKPNCLFSRFSKVILAGILGLATTPARADDPPKAHDPKLVVEQFAATPDIVHPVSIAFDRRGRLLVIESHTHFRPAKYQGPPHDRIRVLDDTDGDGKADRFTTFFEGTTATMDIDVHPDGTVYVATRNEIMRLHDADGDGKADRKERIAFLKTDGNYPHNGLSGLCFDSRGNLYFGMGENLGASYELIGADGTKLTGGGEGGNIYWCTADGKKLRRVATGFWNPFGICTDIFGRIFAVDNDPDAMPPCRMLHVVEGGDYGYQVRYGRSGRHPFQSWNGQLPGTLPMATGTGESPCEILSYESDGLPKEFIGDLLVTAWADHRIERYVVKDKGASVVAERKPFVQGGKDFRPVGLAVAPDGSLFASDWVLRDYNLHNRGAIWHVRSRMSPPRSARREGLASLHRPMRETAAVQMARGTAEDVALLRKHARSEDPRTRAAATTALVDAGDISVDLKSIAEHDALPELRALAIRALVARGEDARGMLQGSHPPPVRFAALGALKEESDAPVLLNFLLDPDPFMVHAAIMRLSQLQGVTDLPVPSTANAKQRIGLLLAQRTCARPEARRFIPSYLNDPDPDIRLLAVKWIADEKLSEFRPRVSAALADPKLSVPLCQAYATALARLDDKDVSEIGMAKVFFARLASSASPPDVRIAALRLLPATHKELTLNLLAGLIRQENEELQLEAVRMVAEHPSRKRTQVLLELARDKQRTSALRAEVLVGAADGVQEDLDGMLAFVRDPDHAVRNEALRALAGAKLTDGQRKILEGLRPSRPAARDLVARALGKPFTQNRPRLDDTKAWIERLAGPADAAVGRNVFFHSRLAGCAKCHRVAGRGQDIGPDLSNIGRTERRHLLESILQPDNNVAPHYQVWSLATADGKTHTGMLLHTNLDEYTYVDPQGNKFKLNTREIAETLPLPRSLMPAGMVDLLTDQELRDLLAYLEGLR